MPRRWSPVPQSEVEDQGGSGVGKSSEVVALEAGEVAADWSKDRIPYGLVWTAIPLLTWLCPCVGHLGICRSDGVSFDFAGPYTITVDNLAFGRPLRYVQLDVEQVTAAMDQSRAGKRKAFDTAVENASKEYTRHMHNLCWDNCHSHVALALNQLRYQGSAGWNMVNLAMLLFFTGKYTSVASFVCHWAPFAVVVAIVATILLTGK